MGEIEVIKELLVVYDGKFYKTNMCKVEKGASDFEDSHKPVYVTEEEFNEYKKKGLVIPKNATYPDRMKQKTNK